MDFGNPAFTCVVIILASSCATTGSIRLVGGTAAFNGRVEVCYNNVWGTVCDDYWDNTEASVACKQLGYSGIPFGNIA